MSDINDSNYVSDDKSADIGKVILSEVNEAAVCCVSTLAGDHIKNRMMHFAVTPDFRFYLTSMKDDPKTKQLALCPRISILAHVSGGGFTEAKEMEVAGRGEIIEDENGRQKAIGLLMERSPVVAQMAQYGKLGLLSFIEVVPQSIKFRRVKDILQGIKPTIINFGRTTSAIGDDLARLRRKIGAWVAETRYPFVMVTAIPVVLGASVAWMRQGIFKPVYFILTLAGAACLHLGSNIINDYFDHKSGNDEANTQFVRPFSGGSRVIQNGLLTPSEVLAGAAAFFALGSAIGIFLTYKIGWPILILGIIGVVSGVFYTAPVLSWAKRGIGETLVGVNFGVLVALGSNYVQTGRFSAEVLFASLPLGVLVSAILWINEIPDYDADKLTGKNTLVVRLGRGTSALVYALILSLAFAALALGVALGHLPPPLLSGFIAAPFALVSAIYALKFHYSSFDMAPANGLSVICFNVMGLTLPLTYLWMSGHRDYAYAFAFAAALYTAYLVGGIKSRIEAFRKMKALAAGSSV